MPSIKQKKLAAITPFFDSEHQRREEQSIGQGCLTNSKHPDRFVRGVYPTHLVQGKGCDVIDTKGNSYVDFICGLGASIIGHSHPRLVGAVASAMERGATLSLSTPEEILCAEKIKEILPWVERMKFVKTGSEGCSAAIRMARAFTGRNDVLAEGYHGWHDEFVSLTEPALGIPKGSFRIKKWDGTHQIDEKTACVIMEPFNLKGDREQVEFLKAVRAECDKNGALLIFDETITGLRVPKYTVANFSGVKPDLIIFGKALGGGLPLSCVGGRADVLDGEYFVSSTFAGERASFMSSIELMTMLQTDHDYVALWESGLVFQEYFNKTFSGRVKLRGYATRFVLDGKPEDKALFMQEACTAGLLFGPSVFWTFPHMEKMDEIKALLNAVRIKIDCGAKLRGAMPTSPFSAKQREKN